MASTDLTEVENKKKGLNNAIDGLMDEVSWMCKRLPGVCGEPLRPELFVRERLVCVVMFKQTLYF